MVVSPKYVVKSLTYVSYENSPCAVGSVCWGGDVKEVVDNSVIVGDPAKRITIIPGTSSSIAGIGICPQD